ncbi:FG-GAP-like repeat-containing protein [Flavobacterium sp.]|uniref:FG-GAP-like repeat-containing protein n=1 Tax=Flavobacterium sp. TaxID=239 RepID=UPI0035B2FBE3
MKKKLLFSKSLQCLVAVVFLLTTHVINAQAPTITSFSPTSAQVGEAVTITGTGFNATAANNIVYFGSVQASVTVATTTSLTVTVPKSSVYAPITVISNGLLVKSNEFFRVINNSIASNTLTADKFGNNIGFSSTNGAWWSGWNDMYVAVGDFDNDGKVDVVKGGSSQVRVHRNLMTGPSTISTSSFDSGTNFTVSGRPRSIIIEDINSDGKLDIITSSDAGVSVLINTSTGSGTISFATALNLASSYGNTVRAADFDLDGKLDLVTIRSAEVAIYRNTSTSSFTLAAAQLVNIPSLTSCTTLAVGDFNKDSKPDIAVGNASNTAILLNGSSSGSISFPTSISLSGGGGSMVIADFDNDLDLDIYYYNRIIVNNYSSGSISSSDFSSFTYTVDGGASAYSISDLNGNGKLEIIGGTTWDANYLMIVGSLPITSSSLSSSGYFLSKTYGYTSGIGLGVDVDGDNKVDYISAANSASPNFSITQNLMLPVPAITQTGTLSAFVKCDGSASATQTFTVSGSNLTANIGIAAVSGFEYSTDNTTFSSTLSIPYGSGTVAATTIYVRMTSSSTGTPSGNISITSTNATTQTVAVSGSVTTIPVVTTQPTTPLSLCENSSYTLGASVTGASSYQWYSNSTNSNTGGTSLGSANFAQTGGLSVDTTTPGTVYYYLVASSGSCSVTSAVSAVTVNTTPIAGTASGTATICSGTTTGLSLTGYTGNIQWQQSANGTSGWANVTGGTGATTASYTTAALSATTYYRAVASSGSCTSAISNTIQITVIPGSVAGTITASPAVACGSSPVTLTLSGYTGTIQWLRSASPIWDTLNGETNATYTTPSLSRNETYRAVVTSGACPSATTDITITYNNQPSGPTVANTTVNYCQGGTATALTATATSGHSLQWYTVASGGTASTTAPTPSTSTSGQSMYYVAQKVTPSNITISSTSGTTINYNLVGSASVFGQTFQLSQQARLTNILLGSLYSSGNNSLTMKIYNGYGGALLATSTNTVSVSSYNYTPTFDFSTLDFVLNSNQTYYFEITGTSSFTVISPKSDIITGTAYKNTTALNTYDLDFTLSGTSITNPCESARTAITVNVNPAPVGGTATAAASAVCSGATTTITLANSTGTIQWQKLVGSTWTDIAGETSATLTTPAIIEATSFRAKLSGQSCSDAFSNTVNVSITTAPLAPGYGLDFNGTNNVISVPNSTTYNYATGNAFTLEAWVKINASANSINTIIGKKSPGGGTQGYAFYVNSWGSSDRKLVFEATTGTFLSTSTIPNDTWTHVAVSVTSAGAATMYINGVASGSGNVTIPASSTTLSIGAFGSNSYFYFNGGLDEIRIWNVAKTASEINTYKNSDVRGFANLDLYYKLNEGTGTTANDSSPNSNHGTLNNFALSGSRSNWVSSSFQDVATISGNSNICLGATTILTHTATGGTWSSATTSVATIDANGIVTAVAAGTSIISYTYTYNGCSFTDTKTITVVNSPVAPTVTSTMNFCQSSTANLSATASSGHTLKWYTVATGGTGSTTVPVVSTSTVASTSYYVSQVNTSTGCESPRAIITAVVNPTPVVSGTSAIEVGVITTLTATTTPASSNAWTSSNTSVATVDNTGVVTAVAPGTTVITYTNSTGCSATKNITVSVGTTQTPVLIHPASNITGATTFRVNYTLPEAPLSGSVRLIFVPVSGGSSIVWTMSNATSVDFNYTVTSQPNATYVTSGTALSYGTYNVTLSYQDAFGSPVATTTNTSIQTLAPPSISFATTAYSITVNNAITPIVPTNTGGVSTYSINPNLPTGLVFNTVTGSISGTPTVTLAQTTFTVTATNAAGSDSKTIQLTVDADSDGDGVPDAIEVQQGTNPNTPGDALDTDGDGVPDYVEVQQGTNPTTPGALDTDGDGVPDYIEIQQGTNPTTPGALDTDGDGVPDYVEVQQGTNPATPGARDTDGDGVPDYVEVQQGTNPTTPGALDTDGDGVPDYIEVQQGTSPTTPGARDTDGDGVPDYVELQQGTSPTTPGARDTDGDGIPDYIEVQQGTNPNQSGDTILDTDGDGIPDYVELQQGTNPTTPGDVLIDTDGDGVPDYIEVQQGTSPTTPGARDTDGDGVPDYVEVQQGTNPTTPGALDTDGDGVPDYVEVQQGTNPTTPGALDTDGDGVPDYVEVQQGTNPTTPGARDTDGDGVPDYVEIQQGTNPNVPGARDTDGDGIPDYIELQLGTNPNVADAIDSDGDGISDYNEGYNYSNPSASLDTDRDGTPNYLDLDSDGDSVLDRNDAFPVNRLEWKDTDHDGTGDNADTDDDNDGILDTCDADVNGDGIIDNGTDMDSDGVIDGCDPDRDGDGVNNTSDNCPDTANANQADRDHDGLGDVCDTIELNVMQGLTPNGDGINDTWVIYNIENHPGTIVRVFNTNGSQVYYSANYQNNWTGNLQGSSEMLPTGSYMYQVDLGGDGTIDSQGWLYITK